MATKPNPTVLRRQLGAELRRRREHARRTVADVAGELGWSESKLSRIETANTSIRDPDLQRLFELYQVGDTDQKRIRALAGQSRQKAWWEAYGDALPDAVQAYIGFESEASSIFQFTVSLIPGLLQSAEYASALIRAISGPDRADVIDEFVAARMARQAVLVRDPAPKFWAIIDEAALRRPIGGAALMRRQLQRLAEAAERPTITIQVLPFAVGGHRGLDGPFTLLEFPDSEDPLVYCDGMTGGVFRSKPAELRRYWTTFEGLREAALDPDESVEFVAAAAKELK
jgi:transcriptional regulator with XRE-family HTH domain